ncbi:hypothetical protein ACFJIY_18620 [Pimelobacter simplex]|uniref:hypothetical protein n=1 Tax=Nocardioides simplex TaxID=2045 RepID=UPI00366F1D52
MGDRARLTCATAMVGAAALLAACGEVNAPATPSPGPTAPAAATATTPAPSPSAMGEAQDLGRGLSVRVSIDSTGGDARQTWLSVMVSYENHTSGSLTVPAAPSLHCAQSAAAGLPRAHGPGDQEAVPGGLSGGQGYDLLLPPDAGGRPLTACRAPAYVAVGGARWRLGRDDLAYLNNELARDPGRPYRWTDADPRFSSGYQVVFVPGASAAEALAALAPVKRKVSQERFWAVRVAEREDGVVLFTWGLISDERIVALSRIGGLAASYGNTVEGDDHVLVARDGRSVRSFDPFLDYAYDKSRPLPEEKGLDLENDTGPASWTLLDRLTSMHVARDWLLDPGHPAYLLGEQ